MNPEVKQLWIDALLSGEYQQGKMALKHGDDYCCWGVLCDISGLGEWRMDGYGVLGYRVGEATMVGVPEGAVLEWAGIKDRVPYNEDQLISSLASFNDADFTFKQIARLIEMGL